MKNKTANRKQQAFRRILNGEGMVRFFRRQLKLIVLLLFITFFYIDNRYSSQQEVIRIDQLKKELKETRLSAVETVSNWVEATRRSHVMEVLSARGSTLHATDKHPVVLTDTPNSTRHTRNRQE